MMRSTFYHVSPLTLSLKYRSQARPLAKFRIRSA